MEKKTTNQKQNKFLVQGSILAIASIVSRIIGLLYRLPMTAIIGKRGNDYYGTAMEIYNIILLISAFSIPLAVSKLVAARYAKHDYRNMDRIFKGSLIFACISGGVAALVMFFGADFFTRTLLKTPQSMTALRVLAPVVFLVAVVGVFRGFFQGLHTMIPSAISQIVEQIVNAIVSVVAAYFLFGYGMKNAASGMTAEETAAAYGAAGGTLGTAMGALFAFIVVFFVYMVFNQRASRRLKRSPKVQEESYPDIMRLLVITIIPVLLSTTLYNVSGIVDQGIFKNLALADGYAPKQISEWWGVFVGQYRVLVNVPISIASAIAASSVPALTGAFQQGQKEVVKDQVESATHFIMLIAFPCMVGMMVLGGPLMKLLFNDADPVSGYMLVIGAMSIAFYSLSTLSNGLLQGIDRLDIPVKNAAVALVIQAGFLYVMMEVFHLHIYAVVLTNAFYALLMCVLNGVAVHRHAGAKEDIEKTFLLPLDASLVMGIAVFAVYRFLHLLTGSNAVCVAAGIVTGIFVYFVAVVKSGAVSETDMLQFPKGALLCRIAKRMHLL